MFISIGENRDDRDLKFLIKERKKPNKQKGSVERKDRIKKGKMHKKFGLTPPTRVTGRNDNRDPDSSNV